MNLDDQWIISQYECFEREIADLWQLSPDGLRDQVHQIAKRYVSCEISTTLYDRAIANCQQRIENANKNIVDDPHAQFQLGYYYQYGCSSLGRDLKKAKYHYQKALEHNYYPALYQVGLLYSEGKMDDQIEGSNNDTTFNDDAMWMTIKMFVKAAATGLHEKAMRALRSYYLQNDKWTRAINQLKTEYEEQIEKAADEKDVNLAEVYNILGFLECFLDWCQEVEGDEGEEPLFDFPQQAYEYFLKAAELGIPNGFMNYAFYRGYDVNCVDDDTVNVKTNSMIMAKYYLKAAQGGCQISWQKLYDILNSEFKSDVSTRQLLTYIENALKYHRFSDVLCSLARVYAEEDIPKVKSYHNIVECLEEAVVSNHSYATDNSLDEYLYLGLLYEHGVGVERDINKAAHFYACSVINKCESTLAVCRLAKLIEKKKLKCCQISDAVKLYESTMLAIKQDVTSYAQYRLGNLFHGGNYISIGMWPEFAEYHYDGTSNALISLVAAGKARAAHLYHLGKMHAIGCIVDPDVDKALRLYSQGILRYRNTDYLDRYYAVKAKLQLEHIKYRDSLVRIEQVKILQDELIRLELTSSSQLMMSSFDIIIRHLSYDIELSYRQPVYAKYLKELEVQPDSTTHYHVGNIYFRAEGFKQVDPQKAMSHLCKAADMKHPLAQIDMLHLYGCEEKGDDESLFYKTYSTAKELAQIEIKAILKAAYQGDRRALTYLKRRLDLHKTWNIALDNVIKSHRKILSDYVHKRLRTDSTELARIYLEIGYLTMAKSVDKENPNKKVIKEIERLYGEAAILGDMRAMFFTAMLHDLAKLPDRNTRNDSQSALKYYQQFANINMQCNSSINAEHRTDDNKSNNNPVDYRVFNLLQQSCRLGLPDAVGQVAMIFLDERYGQQQDTERFRQLAELALATTYSSEFDTTFLLYHLAFYYYHYSGAKNRYEKAAHYSSLDAYQQVDDGRTRCLLAKMLEKKKLPSASATDSIRMYLSACYLNNDLAGYVHYRIGKLRANSAIAEVYDLRQSKEHFRCAYQFMSKTDKDISKPDISICNMYHLARMYENGYGVEKSIAKAKNWYATSIETSKLYDNLLGCHVMKFYVSKSKKKLNILQQNHSS